MSDIVDSEMGTQQFGDGYPGPPSTQPPRPPGPSFLETGPVPPSPHGNYIEPNRSGRDAGYSGEPVYPGEPVYSGNTGYSQDTGYSRDTVYWGVVAAAIVVVGVLFWAISSLFSSTDPDTVTDNALVDPAAPAVNDESLNPVADEVDPGSPTVESVVPFFDENQADVDDQSGEASADDNPVMTVTTLTVETTTPTTAPTTTTQPPTTEAPTTAAPTTPAPTTAAPTTAAPTTVAETTTSQAPTTVAETTATEAPATTEAPTTQPAAPTGNDSAIQQEVLAFTNQARADNGCPALSLNNQLNSAADSHSEDMAARGYFDHNSPEGEGPGTRVAEAGYTGRGWGENIAQGYGSAAAVVEGWMNSPGHRANILNCDFSELGVGYAEGSTRGNVPGLYWTQVFGIR